MLIEVEVGPGQWQVEPISVGRISDITAIYVDGKEVRFRPVKNWPQSAEGAGGRAWLSHPSERKRW
jgi:hypothetical protein